MSKSEKKPKRIRFMTTGSDHQMKIRIPPFFKEELEKEAEKNGRTRMAELLIRLGQTFHEKIKEELELEKS